MSNSNLMRTLNIYPRMKRRVKPWYLSVQLSKSDESLVQSLLDITAMNPKSSNLLMWGFPEALVEVLDMDTLAEA